MVLHRPVHSMTCKFIALCIHLHVQSVMTMHHHPPSSIIRKAIAAQDGARSYEINSPGAVNQVMYMGKTQEFVSLEENVGKAGHSVKDKAEAAARAASQEFLVARRTTSLSGSGLLVGICILILVCAVALVSVFFVFSRGTRSDTLDAADASEGTEDQLTQHGGDIVAFLSKVDLFKRLPKADILHIVSHCDEVTFQPGQEIVTQGSVGDEFFVVKSGTAKVMVNGNMVAALKSGAYFGENSLLRDCPRNATIVCQAEIEALKLTRKDFKQIGLNEKLNFGKRGAVGCGAASDAAVKPPCQKSPEETKLITDALKTNVDLNSMLVLNDEEVKSMIALMWKDTVAAGTNLVQQGDMDADYFFIVNSGEFDVSKDASSHSSEKHIAENLSVAKCGPGTSFGELSLLYFAPRSATVTATCDSSVFVIASQQFKAIISALQTGVASSHIKHLSKVDILKPLKDTEKMQLAEALTDFVFTKGETIFEAGEAGVLFYILVEGEVDVMKNGKSVQKLKATSKSAHCFGEGALLSNEKRAATIKVLSPTAVTLTVDKATFDMLIGPLGELTRRSKGNNIEVQKTKPVGAKIDKSRFGMIKYKDLEVKSLLGCGGFGTVRLVEHKVDNQLYALKGLSKGYILQTKMQTDVMNEKNMQLMCDSPFIIKLFETYNGDQDLYLLLELAPGGELFATYNKKGLWGNEQCAKFYVAGTVFAFEHLHNMKVVFRDLKPENLLLNADGQVKLTDMGLAKVCIGKTFTCCGTPDYFAPEVLGSKGHNEAVDWWALGILTFELLSGSPAFESDDPMDTYKKIQKGINKVKFPRACTGSVEPLIKDLCHQTPSERVPMRRGGTGNIKKHEWYKHFDWAAMENLTMDPPYKPSLGKKKVAESAADEDDMPPQVFYKDPKNGWDKDFATST